MSPGQAKPDVDAAQFATLDLRVGRILHAEPFPEARRPALKLQVDFGPVVGRLWTSARITNYAPDDLPGRQVVGAVNLGVRRIAGFDSQFLVLGAYDRDGSVRLLSVDGDVPVGAVVA